MHQQVVGLLPHVLQQKQKNEVDFSVSVIKDKPVVHSLQVGEFYDANNALLAEKFAAVVDEVVNEQYFVRIELIFGEDEGEPVEEIRMCGVHDEVVETLHEGCVGHVEIKLDYQVLEIARKGAYSY